jgi:deoxycytidine triphosphate deaminase
MQPLTGKEAMSRLTGMVNAKYQVHAYSVDLTVKKVYVVEPSGQVDFGGTEYIPSARSPVSSLRRRSEDKYEWWDLARGCYILEYNEGFSLAENEIAVLEPDERLLRCGDWHPTSFVRGHGVKLETLLQVGALHALFKQNARVSRLRILRFELPSEGRAARTAAARPAAKKGGAKRKRGR